MTIQIHCQVIVKPCCCELGKHLRGQRRNEPREVKPMQNVHSSQLTCLSSVLLPAVSPPHPFHPVGAARPPRPTSHGLALPHRVPPLDCPQRGAQFLLGEMMYVFFIISITCGYGSWGDNLLVIYLFVCVSGVVQWIYTQL